MRINQNPRISLKGLAEFSIASPAHQRKILFDHKYPDTDEATGMRLYYKEAIQVIRSFYRGPKDVRVLYISADKLLNMSMSFPGRERERLRHNASVIKQYALYFAEGDEYSLLTKQTLIFEHAGVKVTCLPELHLASREVEKHVKLEFSKEELLDSQIELMRQVMFEAIYKDVPGTQADSIILRDVRRGEEYKGRHLLKRTQANLHAMCENIAAIWPTI